MVLSVSASGVRRPASNGTTGGSRRYFTRIAAGDVIAWVREDGIYLEWYASGVSDEVAD